MASAEQSRRWREWRKQSGECPVCDVPFSAHYMAEVDHCQEVLFLRAAFEAAKAYIHCGPDNVLVTQLRYTAWMRARQDAESARKDAYRKEEVGEDGALDYEYSMPPGHEALIREILEAVCRRDGISLVSGVEPGAPAANYELALRLGIGEVFGIRPNSTEPILPEFESEGEAFEISGRGWGISVLNPGGYTEPGDLSGQEVLLDGQRVTVRGVETFAIGRPYPDRLSFALLLDHPHTHGC